MNKTICFIKEESCYYPGKWIIRPVLDKFYLSYTTGSYMIIEARLLGVNYANFLRICRDVFGATIIGKNSKYPVAYFNNDEKLKLLLDILNTRANLVLWERNNP